MTNQLCRCDQTQPLLTVIGIIFNSIVQSVQNCTLQPSIFDCKGPPKLSILEYVKRIYKYMNCSKDCLIMALIFIDRIQEQNPDFKVTNKNIHKLVMTSILIAAKYNQDIVYQNTYYAKVSGFGLNELNELQRRFLQMIQFKSYISLKIYKSYKDKLQKFMEGNLNCQNRQKSANKAIEETQDPMREQAQIINC